MNNSQKPGAAQDSPLTLQYAFASDPNPIRVSTGGSDPSVISVQVMVSNPQDAPVQMTSISIDIPMGEDSQRALSSNADLPQPNFDQTSGWSMSSAGETVTLYPPNGEVAGAIIFSLDGITVNDTYGIVPIKVTEDGPPKLSDDQSYALVKQEADFPITEFYANPQTLYEQEQTTTLFWKCSDQGKQYVYSVHSDSWQPKDCLNNNDCFSCGDGTTGVTTEKLTDTTIFALDVIQGGSIYKTLYTTVNVITPNIITPGLPVQDASSRYVTISWLALNAQSCQLKLDGVLFVDNVPVDTYDDGYTVFLTSAPGPHQLTVVAQAKIGAAQGFLDFPDISISEPTVIPMADTPESILVTPDGNYAFVLCQQNLGGYIAVIDLGSNTVEQKRIGLGEMPTSLAITPDGHYALVCDSMDNNVVFIDVPNRRGDGTVNFSMGSLPTSVAVTPDGKLAVVGMFESNTAMLIDLPSRNVLSTVIKTGSQPSEIAITPDSKLALVANYADDDVTVIDLASRTAEGKTIAVGKSPLHLAITPDGTLALVTNSADNTVTVIDIASRTAEQNPIKVGNIPSAIAISPDGTKAFVANINDSTVTVINISTRTALSPAIGVGQVPQGIAFTPDGEFAYVSNQNSGDITVI